MWHSSSEIMASKESKRKAIHASYSVTFIVKVVIKGLDGE
jgi:hypothetical protein